eukprot:gene20491-22507_t
MEGRRMKILLRHRNFIVLMSLVLLELRKVSATCSDPEVPKDGWRSSPNKHIFATDETVHYYCKKNYTMNGAPKVRCLSDGSWDVKPPTCLAYCQRPNDERHRGFSTTVPVGLQEYDVGTRAIFYCHIGFRISGSNNVACNLLRNGRAEWSTPFPTCVARECENKLQNQLLINGDYNPRSKTYSIGDIVTFSCDAGFELQGAKTIKCTITGLWSAITWPRCAPMECRNPPAIPHGSVILKAGRYTAGTTIRYNCKKGHGYYLFGSETQTCTPLSNGNLEWSPKRPECITRLQFEQYCALQYKVMSTDPPYRCVLKVAVEGGQAKTTSNTSLNTLAVVTGTTGGLLGFLLVVIGFVLCQRRRLVRRMRLATTRRARSAEDERMLIYYSNDYHFFLPSYDEAMRSETAEPPPFEDVVEENRQQQLNDPDDTASETSAGDDVVSLHEEETAVHADANNDHTETAAGEECAENDQTDARDQRISSTAADAGEGWPSSYTVVVEPNRTESNIVTNPVYDEEVLDDRSSVVSTDSKDSVDESSPLV